MYNNNNNNNIQNLNLNFNNEIKINSSKNFKHVTDFYILNNKTIKFEEMTFTPI
jgi:hypothetical protein